MPPSNSGPAHFLSGSGSAHHQSVRRGKAKGGSPSSSGTVAAMPFKSRGARAVCCGLWLQTLREGLGWFAKCGTPFFRKTLLLMTVMLVISILASQRAYHSQKASERAQFSAHVSSSCREKAVATTHVLEAMLNEMRAYKGFVASAPAQFNRSELLSFVNIASSAELVSLEWWLSSRNDAMVSTWAPFLTEQIGWPYQPYILLGGRYSPVQSPNQGGVWLGYSTSDVVQGAAGLTFSMVDENGLIRRAGSETPYFMRTRMFSPMPTVETGRVVWRDTNIPDAVVFVTTCRYLALSGQSGYLTASFRVDEAILRELKMFADADHYLIELVTEPGEILYSSHDSFHETVVSDAKEAFGVALPFSPFSVYVNCYPSTVVRDSYITDFPLLIVSLVVAANSLVLLLVVVVHALWYRAERERDDNVKMAADMVHEVLQPAQGLSAQLLRLEAMKLPAAASQVVGVADSCHRHMLTILQGVMCLQKGAKRVLVDRRAMQKKRPLSILDLKDVVAKANTIFYLTAAKRRVDLVYRVAADCPRVIYADEGALNEVLFNLITNAVKFSPDGGGGVVCTSCELLTEETLPGRCAPPPAVRSRSRARPASPPSHPSQRDGQTSSPSLRLDIDADAGSAAIESLTIAAGVPPPPAWLCFRVTDTGKGMTPQEAARLFKRFSQTAAGRAKGAEGHGLGLSISRDIVKSWGGEISVELNPQGSGKGCSFWFAVPLSRFAVPPALTDASSLSPMLALKQQSLAMAFDGSVASPPLSQCLPHCPGGHEVMSDAVIASLPSRKTLVWIVHTKADAAELLHRTLSQVNDFWVAGLLVHGVGGDEDGGASVAVGDEDGVGPGQRTHVSRAEPACCPDSRTSGGTSKVNERLRSVELMPLSRGLVLASESQPKAQATENPHVLQQHPHQLNELTAPELSLSTLSTASTLSVQLSDCVGSEAASVRAARRLVMLVDDSVPPSRLRSLPLLESVDDAEGRELLQDACENLSDLYLLVLSSSPVLSEQARQHYGQAAQHLLSRVGRSPGHSSPPSVARQVDGGGDEDCKLERDQGRECSPASASAATDPDAEPETPCHRKPSLSSSLGPTAFIPLPSVIDSFHKPIDLLALTDACGDLINNKFRPGQFASSAFYPETPSLLPLQDNMLALPSPCSSVASDGAKDAGADEVELRHRSDCPVVARGLRALILDDDEMMTELAPLVFGGMGCEVHVVSRAAEALTQVRRSLTDTAARPFDLMVTDMSLDEETTGLDVIREVRALERELGLVASRRRALPILLSSGNALPEAQILAQGAQGVAVKPLREADILQFLDRQCGLTCNCYTRARTPRLASGLNVSLPETTVSSPSLADTDSS